MSSSSFRFQDQRRQLMHAEDSTERLVKRWRWMTRDSEGACGAGFPIPPSPIQTYYYMHIRREAHDYQMPGWRSRLDNEIMP